MKKNSNRRGINKTLLYSGSQELLPQPHLSPAARAKGLETSLPLSQPVAESSTRNAAART